MSLALKKVAMHHVDPTRVLLLTDRPQPIARAIHPAPVPAAPRGVPYHERPRNDAESHELSMSDEAACHPTTACSAETGL